MQQLNLAVCRRGVYAVAAPNRRYFHSYVTNVGCGLKILFLSLSIPYTSLQITLVVHVR